MSDVDDNVQDPARLWQLQQLQILDTPPEEAFDDIVKIASALCGTPIALVSLVDAHRQWFKARVGLAIPETPIEQAVCAHALGKEDLLEIPDLTADDRTRENALVTPDDGIRFYAGAPLTTSDGFSVGTLCVIDNQPRPEGLSDEQREALAALGRQVVRLLETRQSKTDRDLQMMREQRRAPIPKSKADADRKKSERTFADQGGGQNAGRVGTFEIERGSEIVKMSPEFCQIFGLEPAESYSTEIMMSTVHPDDRMLAASRETRDLGTSMRDVEYRVIRPSDGKLRWIARRASFDFDANGDPIRMFGTVHDITERRFAHDRIRFLLELGDRLHVAESVEDAAGAAADVIRGALGVTRAGYASFNLAAGRVVVEQDATMEGFESVKGWRPTFEYPETLEKMREGKPIAIRDINELPWMENEIAGYTAVNAIAQLWIPLTVHDVLVGALFLQNAEPREWSVEEQEFCESVAYRTYMTIAKLQAEADQQVLNRELGHRLKNMLAMIMALATQSLKNVTEKDAVETFRKRLLALGSAHEDLLERNWSGANVRAVLTGVLGKIVQPGQLELSGPDIVLGPRASLSLSLIAHELATNALKYGALSAENGQVRIEWEVDGDGETERFMLRWAETGGPAPTTPDRRGFGSQLIDLGLMGTGDARVELRESGLVAEFTAPLQLARNA